MDRIDDCDSAAGDQIDLSALPGDVSFIDAFSGAAGEAAPRRVDGCTIPRIDTDGDRTAHFRLLTNETVTGIDPGRIL